MTTTNLQEYKKVRKIKKVVKELGELERLLTLVLKGLTPYKKYTPVRDILQNVLENKSMVNVYYKKYKDVLNNLNEDKQNKLD